MSPAELPVLHIDGVSVRFPRQSVPVLDGVSLRLSPGERVIVLGASGSGKSTILHAVTGVIPHSITAELTGVVRVSGVDTKDAPVVELSRRVGVLAQDPSSGICLPAVDQELALPLENRGVPPAEISPRIDRALTTVGASALRERETSRLSGGEGQRVALAAALIAEPAVLLLDEPTSMLDPAGVAAVRDALGAATADYGPAVVLVEHRIDDFAGAAGIAGLPPRALVLGEHGRVLADGPTAQVLETHASNLNKNGCWLPLESELLAVTGAAGGLRSAKVRDGVLALAEKSAGVDREQQHSAARDNADTILIADELVISRTAQPVRRRRRAASVVEDQPILRNVNLRLERGEIVALLGANGIGKTSLLLTLAGLLPPARGTVAGARPGLVFQNPEHQFVANTVRDEIAHGLPDHGAHHVDDVLARHRLSHLAGHNPFRLSGGEKRRLSLAAMLAHDRPVLLADEPTFGLDRRDTISAMAALRAAATEGRVVLFASHDLRTVSTLADRVIVLAEGTVIADGPTFATLRRREVLERAGLSLTPLLDFLLTECDSDERVRRVLARLDGAVSAAAGAEWPDGELPADAHGRENSKNARTPVGS